MEERWTSDPTVAGSSPAAIVIFVGVAKVHPRWGSNPQPPAPGTDALPLRHAGTQKWWWCRGHAGARTQDLRLIRATLYRLSYTTPRHWSRLSSAALSVAQLVEHVTVDVCDHRVAGSIPAAERRVFGEPRRGGVAQMVERSLSMREVQGSIPCISNAFWHDGHPWSSWL